MGAGFIYPIAGSIVTMPGLPGSPRKPGHRRGGQHPGPIIPRWTWAPPSSLASCHSGCHFLFCGHTGRVRGPGLGHNASPRPSAAERSPVHCGGRQHTGVHAKRLCRRLQARPCGTDRLAARGTDGSPRSHRVLYWRLRQLYIRSGWRSHHSRGRFRRLAGGRVHHQTQERTRWAVRGLARRESLPSLQAKPLLRGLPAPS